MATQTRTEGEPIANLEGRIAHLATKADIGNLDAKIEALRAKLNTLMWIVTIAIPITGIVVGIVVQVLNNLPG